MIAVNSLKYKSFSQKGREAFLKLFEEKSYRRTMSLLIGAIILYPAWTINDYLFSPEWYIPFLYMRLGVLVILLILFPFFKKHKVSAVTALHIILFPIITEVAFMCSVVNEEALTPFLLGFTTVYAVTYVLIIVPPKISAFYLIYGIVLWVTFIAIFKTHPIETYFKKGGALFITVSIFTLILNIFSYQSVLNEIRALVLLDESHRQLEVKNKEIIDSINYARRIQNAILPTIHQISSVLPHSFLFYKPKDIVSGDFYWMEIVRNYVFFAAADCTGHGVPGAMVSVVCSNALSKVVIEEKELLTDKILQRTKTLVIERFARSGENIYDGMDISLCRLNKDTLELQWSGANNPLYIIRNNKLIETKPDRQPIGKHFRSLPFTAHTIQLQKDDTIYLFTDGFADQFGGPKGKKYKYAPFRELLLSIQNQPMEQQRETLYKTFTEWKGNLEQVDDVCIFGVKV